MSRPFLLTIVGRKHSGKTTTLVRLAAELGRRGRRVMSIKHGSHTFNIDPATTDTYRHYHEGAVERVAMVSPDKFALVSRWSEELTPQAIAERYMSDADIVLCEGFKASPLPRVEVFRAAAHPTPLFDSSLPEAPLYRALVTDVPDFFAPCPVIALHHTDWVAQLADVVERTRTEADR
jgi:molybdopterin-guanine dinucleotide biosynthesis protein B